jgi:hypothetical protein
MESKIIEPAKLAIEDHPADEPHQDLIRSETQ